MQIKKRKVKRICMERGKRNKRRLGFLAITFSVIFLTPYISCVFIFLYVYYSSLVPNLNFEKHSINLLGVLRAPEFNSTSFLFPKKPKFWENTPKSPSALRAQKSISTLLVMSEDHQIVKLHSVFLPGAICAPDN